MHTNLGERKKENFDVLSASEKEELKELLEVANKDSGLLPVIDKSKSKDQADSRTAIAKSKEIIAENKENKRYTVLTAKSGLESHFQKGILGFEMISVDKITIHKGIINEEIDRSKVESIQSSILLQFDPKLSVIYVTPVLKDGDTYAPGQDTQFKALDGRHLLTAIKNIYQSGKTLKGLEINKVMAVVVNNPGVVSANYANLRHRFLSSQHSSQILIQDLLKLYMRIVDITHDRDQALEIVKNAMVSFNFQKDDVTALGKMSKWSESALKLAIEIFESYETFQSLDSDSSRKSNLQKRGGRLAVPKLVFHRIAKLKEASLFKGGKEVLDRKMKLAELADWSMNMAKLDDIKVQVMDISRDMCGDLYESYEELTKDFGEVNDSSLMKFSKSAQGQGFKTGDRLRLEQFVSSTLRKDAPDIPEKTSFEDINNISSDRLSIADLIVLNAKTHTQSSISYYLKKQTGLILVCHTQSMFHQVMRTVCTSDPNQNTKLFTIVVRNEENLVVEENTEGSFTFLILTGQFEILHPPLRTFYDDLQSALSEMATAVTPEVTQFNHKL